MVRTELWLSHSGHPNRAERAQQISWVAVVDVTAEPDKVAVAHICGHIYGYTNGHIYSHMYGYITAVKVEKRGPLHLCSHTCGHINGYTYGHTYDYSTEQGYHCVARHFYGYMNSHKNGGGNGICSCLRVVY